MNSGVTLASSDNSIGTLSKGMHTIRIKLDPTDAITEIDENDNEYTKTFAVGLPDLRPAAAIGWTDKIVVSRITGTHSDDGVLMPSDTLYVDWVLFNLGSGATDSQFFIELYLDGALINTWSRSSPVNINNGTSISDYSIGTLPPGLHTLTIKADATDALLEINEDNNEYTKNIFVGQLYDVAFFRIVGAVDSVITDFDAGEGQIAWSNTVAGVTSLVQRTSELGDTINWVDYAHVATTSLVATSKIIDFSPPAGMVFIPAGTIIGNDPFFMDRTELTKAQWDTVYNWATNNSYSFDHVGSGKAANHPVHSVNWYDCVKWCNARSEMESRTPYYTVSNNVYRAGSFGGESDVVNCDFESNGYRLPTSAQREHAARGGLSSMRFPWGDTIQHARANYYSDSWYGSYDTSPTRGYHPVYAHSGTPYTSPAGSFPANGYSLYDMAGNVSEWCWDASGDNRLSKDGDYGTYGYKAPSLQITAGSFEDPASLSIGRGFRSVWARRFRFPSGGGSRVRGR